MFVDACGRRRGRTLALAGAAVVLALALLAPAARAELFEVNSVADEQDGALGAEGCKTAAGKCTLRAAIEESNSSVGEFDQIDFDETIFDGHAAGTIQPSAGLPAIVEPAAITGECFTPAEVIGPCVGIEGPSGGPALRVENADDVEILGLAVTGAETGVEIDGSEHFKVQASWFGVGLDGGTNGDGTGISVGPESDRGLIGSGGVEGRDVFADMTDDALDIHGASETRVVGDYFGVEEDGTTPAGNGKDIEVASSGGSLAAGTAIGGRVSPEEAATPQCDGVCNVISGSGSSGIDLEGEGVGESAVATTVTGNYIGLSAAGDAAIPNSDAGVRAGEAPGTVIGGPRASEANRIDGGDQGVLADPAAPDLVVRGNLIGVDPASAGALAPPEKGIVVNSAEPVNPAVEIAGNEIRMEGGLGIAQQGFGAWILDNEVLGAETGIKTFNIETDGNLIEGNTIRGSESNGLLVENSFNEILGNEILGAGGAGIRIKNAPPFGVEGNLVGGNSAAGENVIAGSGGAAIEIFDLKQTENEVARNRGFANAGLFIDLVPAPPSTQPPNDAIEPPVFFAVTQAGASGEALPGARVRVFRKQIAAAGEIESFLGEATADEEGEWALTYGDPVPAGTIVAATQTSEQGGTSELSITTTAGGAPPLPPPAPIPPPAPRTRILDGPAARSHSSTARFRFVSDQPGSTFGCKLDGGPFRPCRSPKTYRGLGPGRHTFKVRAVNSAGTPDPTPAKRKFTVLG